MLSAAGFFGVLLALLNGAECWAETHGYGLALWIEVLCR
jgi:hypothetical protein